MSQASCTTIDEPPQGPVNVIDLQSGTDSNIIRVTVYSGRAEISRLFKFNINAGQIQLNISGLPKVLDRKSVRVDKQCGLTIYGVTISMIVPPSRPTSSDTLKGLLDKQKRTEKACDQAKKSLPTLETYLGLFKNLDASTMREAVKSYDTIAVELDGKIAELEKVLAETNEAILVEKAKLSGPTLDANLNLKATIGILSDFKGEVEITLIYVVENATWDAEYDICVDREAQSDNRLVTLTYKGSITQYTGEHWDDVPIALKTAPVRPSLEVPTLTPMHIAIYRQRKSVNKSIAMSSASSSVMPTQAPSPPIRWNGRVPQNKSSNLPIIQHPPSPMRWKRRVSPNESNQSPIDSKGNFDSTFSVPDFVSIRSGGIVHNVTLFAKSKLDATMSLVCVPKKDTKTYWIAKIKNDSQYTFLKGEASVYVDGNLISKLDVPLVNPQGTFDCPLDFDSSIRVTYQPGSQKVSRSGFFTRSTKYAFFQRITVTNTKEKSIKNLKIIDQTHVSENADIIVKIFNPPLAMPKEDFGGRPVSVTNNGTDGEESLEYLRWKLGVASRVIAQWNGADEGVELEALGRDGKLNWVCDEVLPRETIKLVLQWEVTVPAKTDIAGLKFY